MVSGAKGIHASVLVGRALDTRRAIPYSLSVVQFPSFMKHSSTAGDQEGLRRPKGSRPE